jgi:hypothetical protein
MGHEVRVRCLRPEREREVGHAPRHRAVALFAVGPIAGAPVGVGDTVLRGAVGHRVTHRVVVLEVFGLRTAGMQKPEVRRVDVALQGLQPVALPLDEADVGLALGNQGGFEHRQRRDLGLVAHEDPDQPAALDRLVGLGPDPVLEVSAIRHVGHVQALALDVELPPVIDAADAIVLVAPEEERSHPMRATMVHDAGAAAGIAEGDQPLAEQHQAARIAVGDELFGSQRRDPVLAHQFAHHRARPDAGHLF